MSTGLGPGATFAGCRIEAVAGQGGMGVVFRATQLALQRPVALKAIVPELAADAGYRERFQRESHLAASIDHPNVVPVYEAGELDGTLYLIMRWVEGTDLRKLLTASGRLSPGRAIGLLTPVASALAAAHRRGLVHRDVKPANVLIAPGDREGDEHVYLTDFGIALRTGGDAITQTGMFVGTIDYMAPERFQGARGDPRADIYAIGCILFEALTGHVPYDRPTDVSKMFAHVNDPIPSARQEVVAVPERFDAIIAKAMAKRPEDRFASAGELAAALGDAVRELDTTERIAATLTRPGPAATPPAVPPPTATTPGPHEPAATTPRPHDPAATPPNAPSPASPPTAVAPRPAPTVATGGRRRGSAAVWIAVIAVLAAAGALVAILSSGGGRPRGSQSGTTLGADGGGGAAKLEISGGGMTVGASLALSEPAAGVTIGRLNIWASLPHGGMLVRTNLITHLGAMFPASGGPTALAAGTRALWVAEPGSNSLGQFNGDTGAQVAKTSLPGTPTAIGLVRADSTAWVADSSGAVTHVQLEGGAIASAHIAPAATAIAVGEGSVWATHRAADGLVRIRPSSPSSMTPFAVGTDPVSVTLDQGVWIALAGGQVVRFNPRHDRLRVNARVSVAPELDAIAADEGDRFVWAISRQKLALYRITNASAPKVTGTVTFPSQPVALAVRLGAVWVATADGHVTEIRSP